jgi:hypothetical protein
MSVAEIRSLAKIHSSARELLSPFLELQLDSALRIEDEGIVSTTYRVLEEVLGDLTDSFEDERSRQALSRVFACRDEDWIVPFGYAAARAHDGRLSDSLNRRLVAYVSPNTSRMILKNMELPSDLLASMCFADEAADLAGFAQAVISECKVATPATDELRFLLSCRNAWSRAVAEVVGLDDGAPADDEEPSNEAEPPQAGPIINKADPQRGRWGGKEKREGRAVRVVLESVERDVFYFSAIVESTDKSILEPPVIFHLHDSFPRSVVRIRRIVGKQQAVLSEWSAYGVFTIGVQVKNSSGQWTSLEIDLTQLASLPKRFLER